MQAKSSAQVAAETLEFQRDEIKSGARFIPSRRLPIPKARGPYRQ